MSGYGTLTDYTTGQPLRDATAAEWQRTADKLASGDSDAYTGAWRDEDGRAVYVDGGPEPEPPDSCEGEGDSHEATVERLRNLPGIKAMREEDE